MLASFAKEKVKQAMVKFKERTSWPDMLAEIAWPLEG